jgi:hypothetical protein
MDGFERVAVQPVQPLASLLAYVYRANFSEYPQVLGDLWLGEAEDAHQVVHRTLPVGKDIQDLSPAGLGHGVERICCRRCSRHDSIVYPYKNMSIDDSTGSAGVEGGGSNLK